MVDGAAPTGDRCRGAYAESAATRFKPAHTRVIMGAVAGMPSEDLTWHRFSDAVPGQLDWTLENEGR
jgi:hypothetical protein